MNKLQGLFLLMLLLPATVAAQTIAVNPTGVNVNSQNATTVFLTFGRIPAGYRPAEAVWCGELVPAPAPAQGLQCRPDTIYGALPFRYDRSTASGSGGLTDIMAIPPSVVRRAYQAAVRGASAGFFYVRRFVSENGAPDQFVNVTCRMTSGGARVPFALTNVEIETPSGEPVLFIKKGAKLPPIAAEIQYNGTGRLKGRWEIVQPGEEPPGERDLLTEATLPLEERGTQRRYTQISRFNHFLPPVGKFRLPLELSENVLNLAAGQYILLLRIEATDDKESDSNLEVLGVGAGVVHSGAVASFPLPTLKIFFAGESLNEQWQETGLMLPAGGPAGTGAPPVFAWKALPSAFLYRLEVIDRNQTIVFSAVTAAPTTGYRAPSWFWERMMEKNPLWRVAALDAGGAVIARTTARRL